jgi:autonomous glycyl radical cofactor GrcA
LDITQSLIKINQTNISEASIQRLSKQLVAPEKSFNQILAMLNINGKTAEKEGDINVTPLNNVVDNNSFTNNDLKYSSADLIDLELLLNDTLSDIQLVKSYSSSSDEASKLQSSNSVIPMAEDNGNQSLLNVLAKHLIDWFQNIGDHIDPVSLNSNQVIQRLNQFIDSLKPINNQSNLTSDNDVIQNLQLLFDDVRSKLDISNQTPKSNIRVPDDQNMPKNFKSRPISISEYITQLGDGSHPLKSKETVNGDQTKNIEGTLSGKIDSEYIITNNEKNANKRDDSLGPLGLNAVRIPQSEEDMPAVLTATQEENEPIIHNNWMNRKENILELESIFINYLSEIDLDKSFSNSNESSNLYSNNNANPLAEDSVSQPLQEVTTKLTKQIEDWFQKIENTKQSVPMDTDQFIQRLNIILEGLETKGDPINFYSKNEVVKKIQVAFEELKSYLVMSDPKPTSNTRMLDEQNMPKNFKTRPLTGKDYKTDITDGTQLVKSEGKIEKNLIKMNVETMPTNPDYNQISTNKETAPNEIDIAPAQLNEKNVLPFKIVSSNALMGVETELSKLNSSQPQKNEESQAYMSINIRIPTEDELERSKVENSQTLKDDETKSSKVESSQTLKDDEIKTPKVESTQPLEKEVQPSYKVESNQTLEVEKLKRSEVESRQSLRRDEGQLNKVDSSQILKGDETKLSKVESSQSLGKDVQPSFKVESSQSMRVDEIKRIEVESRQSLRRDVGQPNKVDSSPILKGDETKLSKVESSQSLGQDVQPSFKVESSQSMRVDEIKRIEVESRQSLRKDEEQSNKVDSSQILKGDELKLSKAETSQPLGKELYSSYKVESSQSIETPYKVHSSQTQKSDEGIPSKGEVIQSLRNEERPLYNAENIPVLNKDEPAPSKVDNAQGLRKVEINPPYNLENDQSLKSESLVSVNVESDRPQTSEEQIRQKVQPNQTFESEDALSNKIEKDQILNLKDTIEFHVNNRQQVMINLNEKIDRDKPIMIMETVQDWLHGRQKRIGDNLSFNAGDRMPVKMEEMVNQLNPEMKQNMSKEEHPVVSPTHLHPENEPILKSEPISFSKSVDVSPSLKPDNVGGAISQPRMDNNIESKTLQSLPNLTLTTFVPEVSKYAGRYVGILNGNSGSTEAKFNLFPEHLGHLEVKIISQDGQVSVQIVTESTIAKESLEGQLHQLRQSLQTQGLQVQKLEIVQQLPGSFDSSQTGQSFSQGGSSSSQQQPTYYQTRQQVKNRSGGEEQELEREPVPLTYGGITAKSATSIDFTA